MSRNRSGRNLFILDHVNLTVHVVDEQTSRAVAGVEEEVDSRKGTLLAACGDRDDVANDYGEIMKRQGLSSAVADFPLADALVPWFPPLFEPGASRSPHAAIISIAQRTADVRNADRPTERLSGDAIVL